MLLKNLPIYLLLSLALTACNRNDYVTWHCKVDATNPDEKPITMVLEGSTMKFSQQTYNYCGSLGSTSYFDLNCSGYADQSAVSFIPKTGTWKKGAETLSCISL